MHFSLIYAILELTKGESKMLRDKIIIAELKKQSIRESDFWHYKLYNTESYERLNTQADVSLKVAISEYAKILKRRGR